MWRACRPTPVCSLGRRKSPTSTISRAFAPRHFHRPEDHLAEPTIHRRHGDGGVRLSAPALGARRHAALSELRQGDPPAVHRPDHRPAHGAGRGDARADHGAGHPRQKKASTSRFSRTRAARAMSASAPTGTCMTSARKFPSKRTKSTISRSSSTALSSARRRSPPDGFVRDRGGALGRSHSRKYPAR